MELTNLRKEAAKKARLDMIEQYKDDICAAAEHGFFARNLLDKLVEKATTQFVHTNNGYKTVVHANDAACVNLLTINAVDSVLGAKRKADELSREAANQRKKNGKKQCTPNTTRGEDGIVVREKLRRHDDEQRVEQCVSKKLSLEKEVKTATEVLTDWSKLEGKRKNMAVAAGVAFNDPSLWKLTTAGSFTNTERKCLLRLCAPKSGVISKDEKEQLTTFEKINISLTSIMTCVNTMRNTLTSAQKQLDDMNSDSASLLSVEASVEESKTDKEDVQFGEEDELLIDKTIDLDRLTK